MRVTAGGAIVREGKILLGKRAAGGGYYPDCWDIFGGHCEGAETPEQTLRRELREELGIEPVEVSLVDIYDEPHPEQNGPGQHYFFAVRQWSGEQRNLGSEHSAIGWFSLADLAQIPLASERYPEIFAALLE